MEPSTQIVISASRRTDIPAFYLDWFMDRIDRGHFDVINPYNRKASRVTAAPAAVHSIVFWSKDFGPFLKKSIGEQLRQKGFNLFFNFTLNSAAPLLEPHVPSLPERLQQLQSLSKRFGCGAVSWRFDPICFYKVNNGAIKDNLDDFEQIADAAARYGISRCITSFMDHYPKIQKRIRSLAGFSLLDPPRPREPLRRGGRVSSAKENKISLRTPCPVK